MKTLGRSLYEKKLAKRIDRLESLCAKLEAKYGESDDLVRELGQEIQSLRALKKGTEQHLKDRTLVNVLASRAS